MIDSRSRSTFVSLAVLMLCVLALALPVAAQVSDSASNVYRQVQHTPVFALIVSLPRTQLPEPVGLAILGTSLAISAHIARRRLHS